jgi:ribokinase
VDTTAAGDTFTGFFIGGMIRELGVKEAMDMASKAAAIAVTRPGAAPSIPTVQEVEAF